MITRLSTIILIHYCSNLQNICNNNCSREGIPMKPMGVIVFYVKEVTSVELRTFLKYYLIIFIIIFKYVCSYHKYNYYSFTFSDCGNPTCSLDNQCFISRLLYTLLSYVM